MNHNGGVGVGTYQLKKKKNKTPKTPNFRTDH